MEEKKPKLDLSSASGRMVWLVYAQHWVVMAQACSQPSPSSSSISSGTARAGCVSFSWMATLSGIWSKQHRDTRTCSHHIVQGGGTQEVLLLQSQLLALEHVIVGVEDPGDVLGQVPVQHGLDVVPRVEHLQVEAHRALGRPESQGVHNVVTFTIITVIIIDNDDTST